MQTNMTGSERFICSVCNRTTSVTSPGADTFTFVLDTVRLLAGKAA